MATPTPQEYDLQIEATIPRYNQLLDDVVDVVINTINPKSWLDAGGGTGNLILKAIKLSPDTKYVLSDISENMLYAAKTKLGNKVEFIQTSSDSMPFEDNSFDVVTCVQSTHYFDDKGHDKAINECMRILKKDGIFVITENVATRTEDGRKTARSRLKNYLISHGRSEKDADIFLDRYGVEYHPRTVDQHIKILENHGFRDVEVFWYSYGQIGLHCRK